VLGDAFDQQVEQWKQQYQDIMGGSLTDEQRASQLAQLKKTIADAREMYVDQVRGIQELMGSATYGDQQASVNMADKATYDQFELFLGMQTSMLIGQEQGNAVRLQILQTLQTMGGITGAGSSEEMTNILKASNEYLLDIKRSNREILNQFSVKLDTIAQKLARL
jgi:hypothetical protein